MLISYEEYYPYGSTALSFTRSGAPPKRYRYTAKERDEETGLNYHSARYYAPWLARWVSCDPTHLGDGLNLYCATSNNPINLRDTTGTSGESTEKSNVWPQIDQVAPPGSAKEFQVRIIDPASGKPITAQIDRAFPAKNEFMSEPMYIEAKGNPSSPRTPGQEIYHSLIDKGVWAEVRSNSAAKLGLKKGDFIFLKTGRNFTIVDESNLASFKEGATSVYAKSPTLARQVEGKWEFQTFASNQALQEHLAAQGSESARRALVQKASSASEAQVVELDSGINPRSLPPAGAAMVEGANVVQLGMNANNMVLLNIAFELGSKPVRELSNRQIEIMYMAGYSLSDDIFAPTGVRWVAMRDNSWLGKLFEYDRPQSITPGVTEDSQRAVFSFPTRPSLSLRK